MLIIHLPTDLAEDPYNLRFVDTAEGGSSWLLPTVFSVLIVLSLITVIGITMKKGWGLSLGYVLAICNLVIFPYGTAVGLFLLMGLVCSAPLFAILDRKRRRNARRKAAKNIQSNAI